jgi:hypothetical protein
MTRRSKHFAAIAFGLLLALGSVPACKLKTPDDPKKSGVPDLPDLPDLPDDLAAARSLLRTLFPALSDAEIGDLGGKLSLSDIADLTRELEAIRKEAAEFSADLFKSAKERAADRKATLADHNDGYPEGVAALGQICTYDSEAGRGVVQLSGVFNGKESVELGADNVQLTIDGAQQVVTLSCLAEAGPTVDVVFLIDITGSMSNVIASVRDSVVSFVNLLEKSGVRGTVSVVSYQDTVGVNRTFQQTAPKNDYERSPFFKPVSLSNASDVDALRAFVNRLEANRGADAPENLAAAIDFARNSVIGYTSKGEPNVIGQGSDDPAGTEPFPSLSSDRTVFVALTDITFHGDDRTPSNSSLLAPFVPRDAADILASLHRTGTTVHVSDPSWVDEAVTPSSKAVDADYWPIHTGGLGEDRVEGYSLVDLEVVIAAEKSGLLDITLDKIIGSSCTLEFEAQVSASAKLELTLDLGGGVKTTSQVPVVRF